MPTNKQRREAARRKLERQLAARQERARRRRQGNVIASVVGALVIVAVAVGFIVFTGHDRNSASSASGSSTTSPSVSASATPTPASYPCVYPTSGTAARKVSKPATTPAKSGLVNVAVTTTRGDMTFQLNRADAPCTVGAVTSLITQKYYDKTICHRVVTSGIFVLQCGDPTGTGTGGPGYSVGDEAKGTEKYPAGTIAMARGSGANTTGSQFFIVYKDSPALEQSLGILQYTVIGKVTKGLDVVTKVAAGGAATGTDGKPKLAITIDSMKI